MQQNLPPPSPVSALLYSPGGSFLFETHILSETLTSWALRDCVDTFEKRPRAITLATIRKLSTCNSSTNVRTGLIRSPTIAFLRYTKSYFVCDVLNQLFDLDNRLASGNKQEH